MKLAFEAGIVTKLLVETLVAQMLIRFHVFFPFCSIVVVTAMHIQEPGKIL